MAISSTWLSKINGKKQEREFYRSHGNGLYARVRKTGVISFVFRYRFDGVANKITFGTFPKMSLAEASAEAVKCQSYLVAGKEPKRERKLEDIRYKASYTVEQIVREWWEQRYKDHPEFRDTVRGTPFQTWRSFELHVFPEYGDFGWDDVDLRAWAKLLRDIKERSPHIALRLVTHIKSVGKYGTQHGLVNTDPLKGFSGITDLSVRKRKGNRVLSYEEISLIYDTLERTRSDERTKIAFKLMLIYGCRSIELRLAEKTHFDFDRLVWTVPAQLAKARSLSDVEGTANPIVRPILRETMDLFDRLFSLSRGSKYLFPNTRGRSGVDEPLKSGAWLDVPNRINMHIAKQNNGITIPTWSKHDLRRSMRTHITRQTDENGLGVEPWLAEKMIGHKLSGIFETYDKGQYLPEKLRAYKLWYKVLDSIWNGSDKVTDIDFCRGRRLSP